MQNKINLIEKNRQRIALAYLDFCQRHYGGQRVELVLPKEKAVRVDITQQSIEQCMTSMIEQPGYAEFGRVGGQSSIETLYDRMLSSLHKLTPLGVTVMEEMMAAVVSDALENPAEAPLQVVH
ncbi:hypothetical protein [Serratia fonticola]|uniref:hypothetical protein n=1 Tax=Serratia fonticola TaxID=47917 RepID=UPI00093CB541|nr:hypothetical protein [Serratia fonticola]OKP31330.1 hypothetical protein BSQ40_00240 [Serratia fonticola]